MQIRYSQNFINGVLVIGAVNAAIGLASFVNGSGTWMLLVVGGLIIGVALTLRSQPYIVIQDDSVTRYALIDSLTRTYPIVSAHDITLEPRYLAVRTRGETVHIPITKAMINPEDWAVLEARYGA